MATIDEHAETIQHHGHSNRGIAVMIAILAAVLALAEIAEKQAINAYLTHHIAVSDDWAFYQAKYARATVFAAEATILSNLPTSSQEAIERAKANEARMRDEPGKDGMKQLAERAKMDEHARDHAAHLYHQYEYVTGAIQIAIVLASVSVVTNVFALAIGAGVIGALAGVFGVLVALGVT